MSCYCYTVLYIYIYIYIYKENTIWEHYNTLKESMKNNNIIWFKMVHRLMVMLLYYGPISYIPSGQKSP